MNSQLPIANRIYHTNRLTLPRETEVVTMITKSTSTRKSLTEKKNKPKMPLNQVMFPSYFLTQRRKRKKFLY